MKSLKLLHELEELFQELEIQYKIYLKKSDTINELTNKLLMVIKNDNFNSAEAYNYCKILKELLIKKQEIEGIKSKYQKILSLHQIVKIQTDIERKEKEINNKKYTPRIFKQEDDISSYLNDI
jgi:predicted RND superfamily exporter protein